LSRKKRVLLLVETSRSFGRMVIQGVSRYVLEHRDWSFFFQDRGLAEKHPHWLEGWDGDGIIARSGTAVLYDKLLKKGLPLVELQGDGKYFHPHVEIDEPVSCRMAAAHFWERGFRDFAFFSMGHNWWSAGRYECFRQALAALGATCNCCPQVRPKADIALSVVWWKGCEAEVLAWLRTLPRPVAVFCPWDMQALFLIDICQTHGIMVPEDVAVLGYGNNADLCRWSLPPLSSVAPNAVEIGYQASALLDRMMNHQPLPELPIRVPASHIVTRQSTDIVAVREPTVARAIGFIRENAARNPTILDVAHSVGVSKSTLNRLFRRWLGRSPQEEVAHARMEWAKELLRETDFTIRSIAARLDYASTANFVRAFRELNGVTPQGYRRMCRE
jgi:LacI family transcriptional regulator